MKNNYGFTLLEVIFTLTVWTIIISITVPLTMNSLNMHKESSFFDTLMSDLLHVQTMSHGIYKNNNSITFEKTRYVINLDSKKNDIYRNYPNGWEFDGRTYNKISFQNGTIRKAGTILLQSNDTNYRIIFPFGKGRGYIERQ